VLSVNKGDEIDLEVDGYFSGGSGYSSPIAASVLEDALSQAVQGAGALEGVASSAIDSGIGAAITAMGVGGSSNNNVPGAYLTYMIFDREMNFEGIYGYDNISNAANGSREVIALSNISIDREGYLVAYLSNESNSTNYVYFDNFKVDHRKTNIVSTQDYYPFGLTFNNYERTASTKNRFLYNQGSKITSQGLEGKTFRTERIEEISLDMTKFRLYDYKIGRFTQIDPLADQAGQEIYTPYHYALNNPCLYSDPNGDCVAGLPCPQKVQSAIEFSSGFANAVLSNHTGAGRGVGFSTSTDKLSYAQGVEAGWSKHHHGYHA